MFERLMVPGSLTTTGTWVTKVFLQKTHLVSNHFVANYILMFHSRIGLSWNSVWSESVLS